MEQLMAAKEPNAIVTQRIEITPELIKMRVVPQGWELPEFTPGQFATLGLPGTTVRFGTELPEERAPKNPEKLILRAYSIASSSVAKEFVEFYIGLVHTGSLSPRLLGLRPGDKLWMSEKFKGMFTLSELPEGFNAVLIATGTGVAPYMSMIRTEIAGGLKRRFAVFHGAYHSSDLGYHSELQTLDTVSEQFTYLPTLSHPHEEQVPWNGHTGFVQKLWTDGVLDKAWGFHPTSDNTHVFLCGHPLMIEEMTEILVNEGLVKHSKREPGQIHAEQYFVKL
jgi:ferredoxin--NADP+ reductase